MAPRYSSSDHSLRGDLTIRNSPWSGIPGIGYRPSTPRPDGVVRYCCMSSVIGHSDKALRRIATWSRPGPDLVPTRSRPGPLEVSPTLSPRNAGRLKVTVTQCSDTSNNGAGQRSRIRRMPEPMCSTASMRCNIPNSRGLRGTLFTPSSASVIPAGSPPGLEQRGRHPPLPAEIPNSPNARANVLYRFHAVQHSEQQRIARHTLHTQLRFGHPCRKSPWADHLEPVMVKAHLDVGRGTVIPVCDCVDHRFPDRIHRKFGVFPALHSPRDHIVHVDLRAHPCHRSFDHRIHVAREITPVQNPRLRGSLKQRAGQVGTRVEPLAEREQIGEVLHVIPRFERTADS